MNARVDVNMIPYGIWAREMEIAHYLTGSHSYVEDLHSIIRKFASRLDPSYYMKITRSTRHVLPASFGKGKLGDYVLMVNTLDLMPLQLGNTVDDGFHRFMNEWDIKKELFNHFREYLRIGNSCHWNWFCQWLLLAYGLWAYKNDFMAKLEVSYRDDFTMRPCDFGDADFWENIFDKV